jgi:glycosyltransferase involved in cell wall biosynthesis
LATVEIMDPSPKIALYYDDSAYVETLPRPAQAGARGPQGIMGRQVAGKEFLDAFLTWGDWSELAAVTPNQASAQSLIHTCRTHPSSRQRQRRLQVFPLNDFDSKFLRERPAGVLHFPHPLDARFAWARQHAGPHAVAYSGVTHTLCSAGAIESLRNLLLAPFESYDRLICTSQAVVAMVRTVIETYGDYLQSRFGGNPRLHAGLELIPLGVNTDKFQPATPEERARERARLNTVDDEILMLFVGRLSHHAKAHPFPMFRAVSQAAQRTRRRVHLVLAGWAASPAVLRAFQEGSRLFAPGVRTTFLDGARPENRSGAWKAADVFASLSDNIQETFGLVIVEAMASGLPVVATDWNGYRDLVLDGETGFLIPTAMLQGATADATSRLLLGQINYDHFLAECSQAAVVDCAAATQAFARLLEDGDLRRRMGAAGRDRALREFAWPRVVKAYEAMWAEQEKQQRAVAAVERSPPPAYAGPHAYPAPERTFASYPTKWLDANDHVVAARDAEERLGALLKAPLTNHEAHRRCNDAALLTLVLQAAAQGCTVAALEEVLEGNGRLRQQHRATIAWMMKYDLLRREE